MQTPSAAPNDPQAFLEHAAFLRRLARGLLGDAAAAEDLVQEAWMASLRAKPQPGIPLRAWLAGWVRNRSMQRRREEQRRARREAAVARPDRHSPELETAERLEVLQFVLRTVEALDEPYRTAVRMRFLDDLSAKEVAARLGVPVATVRTRLRRGLARVRAKLDANCPGGRSALLSALVPLAGTFPKAAAAAAATSWFGATLMQSKLALAALTAIIVGASWLGWRMTQAPPEPLVRGLSAGQGSPDVSALEGAVGTASALANSEASAERTEQGASAAAHPWGVRGHAYLGSGSDPFPHAAVRMRIYPGTIPSGSSSAAKLKATAALLDVTLNADEQGFLSWDGSRPMETCWIDLTSATEDYTSPRTRYQIAEDLPDPELDVSLLALNFEATGWVRDEKGMGIAGATVRRSWQETLSNADGSFHLRLPSGRDRTYLEAIAEGYAQSRVIVHPKAGARMDDIQFALRPELVVEGRVLDEYGNAVENATVTSFHRFGDGVLTGPDGNFRLDKLDPGRPTHMVNARKPGYVLSLVDIQPGGRLLVEQDFELARGVRVVGQVLDESRDPVPSAELYIGFSPFAFDRLDAVSDDEGRFEFPSVGRGPQTLVAQAPGLASLTTELQVPEEGALLSGVVLEMTSGRTIAGHVVNEDGEPVVGASVMTTHGGEYIDRDTRTDDQGAFRLESLPEAGLGVEVSGDGYLRLEQELPGPDFEDLRLVLERAGSLAGKVINGLTGEPMTQFRIRLVDPVLEPGDRELWGVSATWVREGHLFDRADGTWDTGSPDLSINHVRGVEASAPGFAPTVHSRVFVQRDPDPDACVITLYPGTSLVGVVTHSATGLPIEGVRIKRFTADRPLREYDSDDVHGRMQTQTDASGAYEFPDLPDGDTHLALLHPSFGRMVSGPIEVDAARGEVEHNVVVDTRGAVHGTLYDAQGKPIAGGTVALRPLMLPGVTSDGDRRIQTEADGTYVFDNLMNGDYEVAHEWKLTKKRGFRHFVRRVRIEHGETIALDLAPNGDASIHVVLMADVDLPPAVPVWITQTETLNGSAPAGDDGVQLGAVARDGAFRLAGLDPGVYRIWPNYYDNERQAFVSGQLTIRCEPGSTTEWVVEMTSER